MVETELDKQIKQAEIRKHTAEAEKAEIEKERADYELRQSKKYFGWRTARDISRPVLGIGVILAVTFSIVIPLINVTNLNDKAELATKQTALAYKDDSLRRRNDSLEKKSISLKRQHQISDSLTHLSARLQDSVKSQRLSLANAKTETGLVKKQLQTDRSKLTSLTAITDSMNNVTATEVDFQRVPGGVVMFDYPDNSMGLHLNIFRLKYISNNKTYIFYPHNFYQKGYYLHLPFGIYKVIIEDNKYKLRGGSFEFKCEHQPMNENGTDYQFQIVQLPLELK